MNARIHIQILTTETGQATNVRTIPNAKVSIWVTLDMNVEVFRIRIRRILKFLVLLDPNSDPEFICTNPDPDPSINKRKK
jgi:hypothetical protein